MFKNIYYLAILSVILILTFTVKNAHSANRCKAQPCIVKEKQYDMVIDGNKTTCFKQEGSRVWFCWEHPKDNKVTPVTPTTKPSVSGAIK